MLSPLDVAHSNYMKAEMTIDAYLKGHAWHKSRFCVVPAERTWTPSILSLMISRYEDLGWTVYAIFEEEDKDKLRTLDEAEIRVPCYVFEMPSELYVKEKEDYERLERPPSRLSTELEPYVSPLADQ